MKFAKEVIESDTPTFREWVYGPPSQLTPSVDPHDETCLGECCVEYLDEEEETFDDCFD